MTAMYGVTVMAIVTVMCPQTGRQVSTGVDIDPAAFNVLPYSNHLRFLTAGSAVASTNGRDVGQRCWTSPTGVCERRHRLTQVRQFTPDTQTKQAPAFRGERVAADDVTRPLPGKRWRAAAYEMLGRAGD